MLKALTHKHLRWKFLFFLLTEIALLSLCVWQIQRLSWKENLLAKIHGGQKKETTSYSNTSIPYQKITLSGTLLQKRFQLIPRTYKNNAGMSVLGYHLVALISTKDQGKVMVELGWVDHDIAAKDINLKNQIRLEGILLKAQEPKAFTPKNSKDLYILDQDFIQKHSRKNHYIKAVNFQHLMIKPLKAPELPANKHLSYALTWGVLAFAWALYFLWFVAKYKKA